MRSDFYLLPYAAQQAIRRGEREARIANQRGDTIAELGAEIERLRKALGSIANMPDVRVCREEAGFEMRDIARTALTEGRK